jgi:hypothetical protein
MNSKQLLSFAKGLIISGVIYFLVAYILFISTFTLGSQTLSEKENIDSLYFYSVLSLLAITII